MQGVQFQVELAQAFQTFGNHLEVGQNSHLRDQLLGLEGKVRPQGVICKAPGRRSRNDAHNLNQAIGRRAQQEVFAIARKALNDLATTSWKNAWGRAAALGGSAKEGLAKALKTASVTRRLYAARLTCQRTNAPQYRMRSTKPSRPRSRSVRDRAGTGQRDRAHHEWAKGSVEYRTTSHRWKRASGKLLKEKDKPDAKAEPKPEQRVQA